MSRIELESIDGPRVREGDHEVISEVCLKLSTNIPFANKIGKLAHIDTSQVVRAIGWQTSIKVACNLDWQKAVGSSPAKGCQVVSTERDGSRA